MPTISIFYGIIVSMFFEIQEKHHLPHIHIRYQGYKASIAIEDARLFGRWVTSQTITYGVGWSCKPKNRIIRPPKPETG